MRAAMLAAVLTAAVLAGCSAAADPVALPSHPPAAAKPIAASPSPTASATAKEQVAAAVIGYTKALVEAQESQNAAVARRLLRPYMVASRVDGLVAAMAKIWSNGERFYGQITPHVVRVTVLGTGAFAYACNNSSSAGLDYSATGKIVRGSQGVHDMNLVTKLSFTGGHWLVKFQSPVGEPCSTRSAAAPSPTASPTLKQQLAATDRGFVTAVSKAEASGSPVKARSLLSPYMPTNEVRSLVGAMGRRWSQGEVYFGENVPHILAVTVRGTVALVHECDDASSAGWDYAATGKIVAGTLAVPILNLTTRFTMTHGRWLVQYQTIASAACKP